MQIKNINVNPNKLHEELIRAGIKPISVENDLVSGEHVAHNTYMTFCDSTDMKLVQQIIDAHDPILLPSTPTLEERTKATEDTLLMLIDMQTGGI